MGTDLAPHRLDEPGQNANGERAYHDAGRKVIPPEVRRPEARPGSINLVVQTKLRIVGPFPTGEGLIMLGHLHEAASSPDALGNGLNGRIVQQTFRTVVKVPSGERGKTDREVRNQQDRCGPKWR